MDVNFKKWLNLEHGVLGPFFLLRQVLSLVPYGILCHLLVFSNDTSYE